jgi:hypothetical protein
MQRMSFAICHGWRGGRGCALSGRVGRWVVLALRAVVVDGSTPSEASRVSGPPRPSRYSRKAASPSLSDSRTTRRGGRSSSRHAPLVAVPTVATRRSPFAHRVAAQSRHLYLVPGTFGSQAIRVQKPYLGLRQGDCPGRRAGVPGQASTSALCSRRARYQRPPRRRAARPPVGSTGSRRPAAGVLARGWWCRRSTRC